MKSLKILLPVLLTIVILTGCGSTTNTQGSVSTVTNSPGPSIDPAVKKAADDKAQADADAKAKLEADAKAKKDAEDKIKADADAKAKADQAAASLADIQNPKWNTAEIDALKNGNLALAVDMIKSLKTIPDGKSVSPGSVIKTPWTYYGKPITFTGTVGIADDYPPDSDFGKFGLASEIVIECDDGTIVDFFSMVPSGDIQVNQTVTITAYPVGRSEVANKVGGKFTHLIAVTNRLN